MEIWGILTPRWGLNHSEISLLLMTAEEIFLYIVLIKDRTFSPKLNVSRVLSIKLIESKPFSKSIFNIIHGRLCVLVNSIVSSICLMLLPMYLPFIYPVWSSYIIQGKILHSLVAF